MNVQSSIPGRGRCFSSPQRPSQLWEDQAASLGYRGPVPRMQSQHSDGLRAGRPGFDSRQCKIVPFSRGSRLTLGPTHPPFQWVLMGLSLGVKWQGREADHSPTASAEVKKGGATPPLPHTSCTGTALPFYSLFVPQLYNSGRYDGEWFTLQNV
jgi:hypothetical protein